MTAVWWVNQRNPQYAIDLQRGYRWSPSRTRAGGVREAWRCLEDMAPGDVWLNWEQQAIVRHRQRHETARIVRVAR